jgi:hypothetical protein
MKIKNIFFEKKLLYCAATGTVDKIRGAREKFLSLPKKIWREFSKSRAEP